MTGIGVELDADFGKLIAKISGSSGHQMPTLSLVLSIFDDAHWSALSPQGPLRHWQLIDLNESPVLTNSSFSANEMILHYLVGISAMDSRLSHLVNMVPSAGGLVPSHQKIAEKINIVPPLFF